MDQMERFPGLKMYLLIIMDIDMPEMDGVRTTQIIRERFGATLRGKSAIVAHTAIPEE